MHLVAAAAQGLQQRMQCMHATSRLRGFGTPSTPASRLLEGRPRACNSTMPATCSRLRAVRDDVWRGRSRSSRQVHPPVHLNGEEHAIHLSPWRTPALKRLRAAPAPFLFATKFGASPLISNTSFVQTVSYAQPILGPPWWHNLCAGLVASLWPPLQRAQGPPARLSAPLRPRSGLTASRPSFLGRPLGLQGVGAHGSARCS